MIADTAIETILKRDRLLVLASLAGVTALAWLYLVADAVHMTSMSDMAMMQVTPWTAFDAMLMFLMWAIMMVGMMLPSAAPMILLYGLVARKQRSRGHLFAPVGAFVAGYLFVWTAFSLGATALQWGLEQAALLSPMMVSKSPLLGGGLLIAAGLYQWTPFKNACLEHCRSPAEFLATRWRKGTGGAIIMGAHHGAYCVGCCWFLMGLLFVGGVMNLLWIAAITAYVLIEKLAPFGARTSRVTGVLLTLAGIAIVLN